MLNQEQDEKKQKMLEEVYQKNLKNYIDFFKNDVYTDDEADYIKKLEKDYYDTILSYVRHLENELTKEKIDSTTLENYSINDLISPELCKNQKLKAILENTFLDGLMYINAYTSSAHFHVRNMIVVETEFLETLPDLIPELKNQNFNTLFNGRNIVEVRYILEQMKVLPKNSELETTVNNYFILRNIRSRFIESIICMLIIHNKDEYTKERVRILKKVSGIYIDIEKYLKVDTKKMILKNEDN